MSILWAEDSAQDQLLIRSALEGEDAPPVQFANDGVLLLEALAERTPALVVLDLKMPRMGGIETLQRIRDDPATRSLPVCIFSAGNQPNEIEACRKLGAIAVLQKPVDYGKFTDAVLDIVRRAGAVATHGR